MAAIYLITYKNPTSPAQNHEITLEWVAPTDWLPSRVRETFHRRYPQASLLAFRQITQ